MISRDYTDCFLLLWDIWNPFGINGVLQVTVCQRSSSGSSTSSDANIMQFYFFWNVPEPRAKHTQAAQAWNKEIKKLTKQIFPQTLTVWRRASGAGLICRLSSCSSARFPHKAQETLRLTEPSLQHWNKGMKWRFVSNRVVTAALLWRS